MNGLKSIKRNMKNDKTIKNEPEKEDELER